jgi:ubiquitin thioesterase protein OTUB1
MLYVGVSLPQGQYEMDVPDFCRRFVEVMQEESDHIHAQALADAVGVPICIAHIDSNLHGGNVADPSYVTMQPEGLPAEQSGPPRVHLLYRPGHYDVLYSK